MTIAALTTQFEEFKSQFQGHVAATAHDVPALQFAVRELRRAMANPTNGDWEKLRRVAKYLVGAIRAVVPCVVPGA